MLKNSLKKVDSPNERSHSKLCNYILSPRCGPGLCSFDLSGWDFGSNGDSHKDLDMVREGKIKLAALL